MGNKFTNFEQVKQALKHLAAVAENTSEAVLMVDLKGCTRFVNTAAAKMHGYTAKSNLAGKPITLFCAKEQLRSNLFSILKDVLHTGQVVGRFKHTRRNGTSFPTKAKVTLLKDKRNKPQLLLF